MVTSVYHQHPAMVILNSAMLYLTSLLEGEHNNLLCFLMRSPVRRSTQPFSLLSVKDFVPAISLAVSMDFLDDIRLVFVLYYCLGHLIIFSVHCPDKIKFVMPLYKYTFCTTWQKL